ncbi:OmpA family protein [Myceligenerans crystallogenes]|uniref:OmpA-like domain-containing protein n=1 Tax=Myceligenerans crystallogenes TaxID=316335 RepID=A0ABN2NGE4_9MICO
MRKTKPFLAPIAAAALVIGLAGCQGGDIEGELTQKATQALSDAGLDSAEVSFEGREATVEADSADDAAAAGEVVAGVDGVEGVTAMGPDGEVALDSAAEGDSTDDADDTATDDATDDEGDDSAGAGDDAEDDAADDDAAGDDATDDAAGDDDMADGDDDGAATDAEKSEAQAALDKTAAITFVTGSAELTADGERAVREAADTLDEFENVRVTIEGHTDSVGPSGANKALSKRRATAVLEALTAQDVDAERLTARGLGESDPVVKDATAASDLAKNRRVEFVVTD